MIISRVRLDNQLRLLRCRHDSNALDWVRNNLKIALPRAVVLAGLIAFLAFGVFGIHTKFIDDEVSESGPVFSSGAAAELPPEWSTKPPLSADEVDRRRGRRNPETRRSRSRSKHRCRRRWTTTPEVGAVVTLIDGSFVDRSHPGSGLAKVLNDGTEQRFLRFEDFETDNGPDLFVYLTRATREPMLVPLVSTVTSLTWAASRATSASRTTRFRSTWISASSTPWWCGASGSP